MRRDFHVVNVRGFPVFPFLHPRLPNFVLGLALGLSLALAWHWAGALR